MKRRQSDNSLDDETELAGLADGSLPEERRARLEARLEESEELSQRAALGYPPVVRLVVLHISGLVEPTVERAAQDWASRLRRIALREKTRGTGNEHAHGLSEGDKLSILGPIPSPVPRLRGRHRRQIMVKSPAADDALQAVRSTVAELENIYASRAVKFDVDVDPTDMW